jgi:hypothetical protein
MPNWRSESSLPSLKGVWVGCEHMFVARTRPVPDISDLDLHWLAGLLEGEGTFLAGPPSAPRSPAIQFWMTDRDVVERAAAMLDAKVMVVAPRRAHWKTTYAVRLRGSRAVVWMRRLWCLMGSRRREQIERAIASYEPDPRRVLDDMRATDALRRLAAGESVKQVAGRFGTSIWSIYDLRLGRTYQHLPRPG